MYNGAVTSRLGRCLSLPGLFLSDHRSSSKHQIQHKLDEDGEEEETPRAFLCPISGGLMNDPVIVSSSHTFVRACVQACQTLAFAPLLPDSSVPNFSTVIPNLALKYAILSWCHKFSMYPPKLLDFFTAEKIVRTYMVSHPLTTSDSDSIRGEDRTSISEKDLIERVEKEPMVKLIHSSTEMTKHPQTYFRSSSDDSIETAMSTPPLQFAGRLSCFSSSSSNNEAKWSRAFMLSS